MKFCQSCGMPLTEDVLGTNADGSKNEDYCMYCYKDGKFLQDCTMEEMIEHCAQFFAEQSGKAERVGAVNEGLEKPITKEEYIGMMKTYFPQLKRWRKTLDISNDEVTNVNPALAGIKELIVQMADKLPIAYISSVDQDGYPWTKAMLKPRKRRCQRLQGNDAAGYDGGTDGCRLKRDDLARWRRAVLSRWRN